MNEEILFTKHAVERIKERDASSEFIKAAILGNVKAISYPSPKNPNIHILTAKDNQNKYWTVIYSENRVITVHRAHKSEEKRYEETF